MKSTIHKMKLPNKIKEKSKITEKKYKIRSLIGKDIFKISKFIKKLGVNRLKEIFEDSQALKTINIAMSGGENQDIAEVGKLGVILIDLIIDCLCDIEEELNKLFESVSNLGKDEISELPLEEYVNMIKDLFMQKTFMDFFGHIWGD